MDRRLRHPMRGPRHARRAIGRRLNLEALEARTVLSAAPWWTPTSPNLADAVNGPLANGGTAAVRAYFDQQAYAATGAVGGFATSPLNSQQSLYQFVGDSMVVDARASGDLTGYVAAVQDLGFQVRAVDTSKGLVEGAIPVAKLPQFATLPQTIAFAAVSHAYTDQAGKANNQAEEALYADVARTQFRVDGTGVKIGVISDSASQFGGGIQDSIASGDLPAYVANNILVDGPSGSEDEGRAMMEQIYDIAPGATLYFASGAGGPVSMASSIRRLAAAGCTVIVDDLFYAGIPFFQDGVIAQAVSDVTANNNVVYLTSAGNAGDHGFETPAFGFGNTTVGGTSGRFMDFDPGSGTLYQMPLTMDDGDAVVDFQFDQPFNAPTPSGVTSNVNIFFYDAGGNVVGSGTTNTTSTQTPEQFLVVPATAKSFAVQVVNGPDIGRIRLRDFGPQDSLDVSKQFGTQAGISYVTTFGHKVSNDAIGVGAVAWYETPPVASPSPVSNEDYSSFGPINILFDASGNRLTSPEHRLKPDISGTDGNNTSFFGQIGAVPPGFPTENYSLPNFFGTSSAAPNVAAVVALMKQIAPKAGTTLIRNALIGSAKTLNGDRPNNPKASTPLGTWDPQGGYGLVYAPAAIQAISLQITAKAPTNAVENTALTNATVATVKVGTGTADPLGFTATIDWGDGTTSTGTVTGSGSLLTIAGNHTYIEGGKYPLGVTVLSANGVSVSDSTTVTVGTLPMVPQGTIVNLKEGQTFDGQIATFLDTDPDVQSANNYSVTVNWSDGTTSPGQVLQATQTSGGQTVPIPNSFTVNTTHVVGGGKYAINVVINGPGGAVATAVSQAFVQDSPLHSEGMSVIPTEGTPFTGVLATFTDEDPRFPAASNYYATIDWGDGSATTPGTIVPNPGGAGFAVVGSHPYGVGDYPLTVIIGNYSGGNTTVALGSAAVADAPLYAQGLDQKATAGASFSGILATFTDSDPRLNATGHYQATVDWGDGTIDAGQVVVNEDGGYLVKGTHAYRAGTFHITTTIGDVGGATTVATGTAIVPDSPITLTPSTALTFSQGVSDSTGIAVFTTSNLLALATDYSATVSYGDGTSGIARVALVDTSPTQLTFAVSVDKVYQDAGTYTLNLIVSGPGGGQVGALVPVTVTAAPVSATATPISGPSKTALTGLVVATFTTGNPNAKASDYAAVVDWGDSTGSTATVVSDGLGGFQVVGAHTFPEGGTYPIQVIIIGSGVRSTVTGSAAISNLLTPVTGGVASTPSGSISATGLTNSSTPVFRGTAEPLSTVRIYTQTAGGTPALVGTGVANAAGQYAITSTSLADGAYTVMASATDTAGKPSSGMTVLYPTLSRGLLTVDTQGPKVASASLNPRTGKVVVRLTDGLSGLGSGVLDASNFTLRAANGKAYAVTGLTVSPVTPGTDQTATLTFATAKPLKKGTYVLSINSQAVTDRAGNVLDERYFVPFPGTYNVPGQTFLAAFKTDGKSVSAAEQFIPPAEVAAAQKHRIFVRKHLIRR